MFAYEATERSRALVLSSAQRTGVQLRGASTASAASAENRSWASRTGLLLEVRVRQRMAKAA